MGAASTKGELFDGKYSVVVENSETEDSGPIHRSAIEGVGPELSLFGCYTCYETFRRGVQNSPQRPCLGYRAIDGDGNASPYIWYSYTQVAERINNLAAGLKHEGLLPPNEDGMKLLAIYMKNRPEWILSEQACYANGGTTVPLYDTLGPDSVEYIVNQTGLTTIVCDYIDLPKVVKCAPNSPSLGAVVLVGRTIPEAESSAKALGLKVYTLPQLERIGADNPYPHTPPSSQDIATFCYTSGTTGNPKGALISHSNLISDAAATLYTGNNVNSEDVHISYLPLPHIFERNIQVGLYAVGASVGFYQGDPLKIMEDFVALKPTISPIVPRLLNRLYDKITQAATQGGGMKKMLFEKALAAKTEGLKNGVSTHPLWDKLIFNKLRQSLGWERLRIMITGSAPVAAHVLDLMRSILCDGILLEGYGQTETSSAATVTTVDDFTAGHVGPPIPCCEIKLVDVPEMGYLHTDTWHGGDPLKGGGGGLPCEGRGEICFRGPHVFKGYYKLPEATADAMDEEGWLHSGDIGLWTTKGQLMIIDRKKNIFKLSQGEYVAPEKIENVLCRSSLIMQAFVYGDSLQSHLVAVVVPDPEEAQSWAQQQGIQVSFEELCKREDFCQAVLADASKVGKEASLAGFEMIKSLYVEKDPFTVEEGLLTPTLKLKRQQAKDKYLQKIQELYNGCQQTPQSQQLPIQSKL